MSGPSQRIVLGISGASGVVYGQRLLDLLDRAGREIHVIISDVARKLLIEERGVLEITAEALLGRSSDRLRFFENTDLFAPCASGSFLWDAMVVAPCSNHTLAAIANGLGDALMYRSAYVALKQRRRLVLLHREMPLTAIDLENMLAVTRAGGIVCPANPPFYLTPETINDLVDAVVGRVLDLLGVEHDLPIRWSP